MGVEQKIVGFRGSVRSAVSGRRIGGESMTSAGSRRRVDGAFMKLARFRASVKSAGLRASVTLEGLEGFETLGFKGRGGMKHASDTRNLSDFQLIFVSIFFISD